jgi:uncharacterized surface protein with fasciclin (FAS1) repeats
MKKLLRLILLAVFTAGIFGLSGCEDHQERYERPPWLGGSSIEILEERGNYTSFLSLMEQANYTEPISKQLFTLFVPDDAAFDRYLQKIGKTSVTELTKDEAVNLFTLHVLRNPRSRFQLIYEYAWSELQGPKGEYASLFHRKVTPSTSIPYEETIRYLPGFEGQERLMYTGPKNIPLFTAEFFHDFGGADDGSDYLFMYPESTWRKDYPADMKGMNWHSAMVIPNPEIPEELEVRTANGFIYFLDRVVEPMPSIEEYMIANQDKFGLYYDILQRFARYGNQRVDEQNRILFRKSYDLIFDLAEERGPSTNTAVPPQNMWSAFLPNNEVLQEYLDNTIFKSYPHIDSVPRVTLFYILQTQLSATLVVPSKMEVSYFNAFGDATEIKKSDIASSFMASNGVIYESKKVLEPNVFTCVPGILFFDSQYSTLLFVLNQANMLSTLANPNADVTLFATPNDKLEEYGIRFNATSSVVEFRGPVDGIWRTMNSTDLTLFAQDQIYKGKLEDLTGEGGFAEMASGNFIKYGNNKAESAENMVFDMPANITEIEVNERNGLLVKVDYPVGTRLVMGKILAGDLADPDVSEFVDLLIETKLLQDKFRDATTKENIPNLKFLAASKYWTAFIPTNEAMAKAREEGIIPYEFPTTSAGKDSLDKFLKYHFIPGNVIFNDGKSSGTFDTYYTYRDPETNSNVGAKVEITNSPNNLAIQDIGGRVVNVETENANTIVRKGVVHKINSVLKYY